VVKFLEYKVGVIEAKGYQTKLGHENVHETTESVQGAINALIFIFRGATMNKVSNDELIASLKTNTLVDDKNIKIIKHIWSEHGQTLTELGSKKIFNVGQVVKMEWKVAMGVESNNNKTIDHPYISIVLTLLYHHKDDSNSNLVSHHFDLSFMEFNNFAKQMKAVAGMLETF